MRNKSVEEQRMARRAHPIPHLLSYSQLEMSPAPRRDHLLVMLFVVARQGHPTDKDDVVVVVKDSRQIGREEEIRIHQIIF